MLRENHNGVDRKWPCAASRVERRTQHANVVHKSGRAPVSERDRKEIGPARNEVASILDHPGAIRPACRYAQCGLHDIHLGRKREVFLRSRVARMDRDRGESHDSSPPTPPYIRVRIRRFDRLSTVGVSRRAGESDSGVRRHGFGPFERRIRASPFLIAAKASGLDIRPHGRFEVSTSKRPSIVQAFSETRSAYYAFC